MIFCGQEFSLIFLLKGTNVFVPEYQSHGGKLGPVPTAYNILGKNSWLSVFSLNQEDCQHRPSLTGIYLTDKATKCLKVNICTKGKILLHN